MSRTRIYVEWSRNTASRREASLDHILWRQMTNTSAYLGFAQLEEEASP
ncbi:hypothetical protein [uncultured Nostoc sp.]